MEQPQASDVVTDVVGYLFQVNFFEFVLVFVGIPVLVIALLAMVTVVPNRVKARPRYRPGADWDYADRFYTGDTPVEVPSHGTDSKLGGARGTW